MSNEETYLDKIVLEMQNHYLKEHKNLSGFQTERIKKAMQEAIQAERERILKTLDYDTLSRKLINYKNGDVTTIHDQEQIIIKIIEELKSKIGDSP